MTDATDATDDAGEDADEADAAATAETDAAASTESDEARYCYCAVAVEEGSDDRSLDLLGVDDEPVRLLAEGDVGLLVHDCAGLYDSEDPTEVQGWLLSHQAIVDAATEEFGTPVPFRFDTIVQGDDGTVRSWLTERGDRLADILGDLAGCAEYRIEVLVDEETLDEHLAETDDRLQELADQRDDSEEGTAFLVDKQYDQRLTELRRERRAARTESLAEDVAAHAREVQELDDPTTTLGDTPDREGTVQARLTLLADDEGVDAVGAILDDVAAEEGVSVRFTGPWPPYSFVPEVDDETA
ncbi:gas vesicle protein GvpL [Halomarina salina]|uniref:Gas vesicle protein GvpL n=1 Tax=Halomarina salina TaxID=1872699 RepID=A0ABD5RQM8_9EURY|nr:GvpL/GvpF family gas vesicle protein [Halomarina salina]